MYDANFIYPLKRFGLKIAILSSFALLQWHSSGFKSVALLFVISGNLSCYLALVRQVPLFRVRRFTYWDEAVAFSAIGAAASLLSRW